MKMKPEKRDRVCRHCGNKVTWPTLILEHLRENPGLTEKELRYDLAMGKSNMASVFSRMVRDGVLVRFYCHQSKCYRYVAAEWDEDEPHLIDRRI